MNRTELFQTTLGHHELAEVEKVFESGWIGYGPKCRQVETIWANRVRARYGVATNSCTSALQIALRLRGVGPGDEVIVPTITFASTAESVLSVGAKPVFCDVMPDTLLIDLESAASKVTLRTQAIIPVLYAGQVLDIGNTWFTLPVIYDCAHAAGSSFLGHDKTCCWSFQAVKNLGCGDGGMLTLMDSDDQVRAKSIAWHGINRSTLDRSQGQHYTWDYDVTELGIKGQMNDITAAILQVQIERMDELRMSRLSRVLRYVERLRGIPGIDILRNSPTVERSSWHLFVIKVRPDLRNKLAAYLAQRGIATGVHYKPLHLHTLFRDGKTSLPVAEAEWQRILSLPLSPQLRLEEVDRICQIIIDCVSDHSEKVAA